MAVCENDIDNQNKIDNFDFDVNVHTTQPDANVTLLPAERYFEVTSDSQQRQHDADVATESEEGHFGIQCDRQLQQQLNDLDVTLSHAERHFRVQSDRLQLKHDTVITLQLDEENLQDSSNSQTNTNLSNVTLKDNSRYNVTPHRNPYRKVFLKLLN